MLTRLSNRVWEASTRSSNTMKWVSIGSLTNPLTYPPQGCKDVEDKLGDLVVWLTKLKDSVTTISADGNHDEAERRKELARFLSHPRHLVDSS